MPYEGYQEKNQEKIEKDFGDAGSRQRNAGETQDRREQCDNEKRQSPAQHVPSCRECFVLAPGAATILVIFHRIQAKAPYRVHPSGGQCIV
jgi:hypothetical protein